MLKADVLPEYPWHNPRRENKTSQFKKKKTDELVRDARQLHSGVKGERTLSSVYSSNDQEVDRERETHNSGNKLLKLVRS